MEETKPNTKDNLETWNKVKQPPASALKKITGGRLTGKTDINPQWRYEVMTEVFGTCGVGWKYTVDKLWREDATDGQVFAFAQVSIETKLPDEVIKKSLEDGLVIYWSQPIQGIGGSMLVEKEKAGLHSNDEGYKMAVTDALGTAMKMLGVAADIYAGKWDGSKYINLNKSPIPPKTNQEPDVPKHLGEELPADVVLAKIKEVSSKDGETNGKKWKVYFLQTSTEKYGTFDEKIADFANTLISSGEMARLQWKQGKKGKEVVALSI
jgi:outer membrane protein assembly factor BamB